MKKLKALVLAAGKGTRLRTEGVELPKVMREANGEPLLSHVLRALDFIAPEDTVIVVGYMRERVIPAFPGRRFAVQDKQLGTGHAVMCAAPAFEGFEGRVLVCCGDMPLLRRESYMALAAAQEKSGAACAILSGTGGEGLSYGRIIRGENGSFAGVVEEKDCTEAQRAIRELNAGVYVFDAKSLFSALSELRSDNAQGEYYLTDVPAILLARGERVELCSRELGEELIGVNTAEQLAQVEDILKTREAI